MPPRPEYGSAGRPIQVEANHFPMRTLLKEVCHFDVEMKILPFKTDRSESHEREASKRLNR